MPAAAYILQCNMFTRKMPVFNRSNCDNMKLLAENKNTGKGDWHYSANILVNWCSCVWHNMVLS